MRYIRCDQDISTLESICLRVIVENISWLVKNKYPAHHIEFLRRVYSDEVFSLLKKAHKCKSKYIEWLLNPHWKEVDLSRLKLPSLTITPKLESFGEAITHLNLKYSLAPERWLLFLLSHMPNLKILNLKSTCSTDTTLCFIWETCVCLESLDVSNCKITDTGIVLAVINNMIKDKVLNLKSLNVRSTNITKKGIRFILSHIPSLEYLKYEALPLILFKMHKSQKSIKNHTHYNLLHLTYRHQSHLNPLLEIWSEYCPNIKELTLWGFRSRVDLATLLKFTSLRKLRLQFSCNDSLAQTSKFLSSFFMHRGELLTEVYLAHASMSVEILLLFCLNLRILTFRLMTFENFDENTLSSKQLKLKHLQKFTIQHANFNTSNTLNSLKLIISSSDKLEELSLVYCQNFKEDVIDYILNVPSSLTKIDVSFSDVEIAGLMKIFQCDKIIHIIADSLYKITQAQLSYLKSFVSSHNKRFRVNYDESSDDSSEDECPDKNGFQWRLF